MFETGEENFHSAVCEQARLQNPMCCTAVLLIWTKTGPGSGTCFKSVKVICCLFAEVHTL